MWQSETTWRDIAQASRLILTFIEGFDEDAFLGDVKTQSSVLCPLRVVGEGQSNTYHGRFAPSTLKFLGR